MLLLPEIKTGILEIRCPRWNNSKMSNNLTVCVEQPAMAGDRFSARLRKEKVNLDWIVYPEIPAADWSVSVRCGMGYYDSGCVKFYDLSNGSRYRFEVIGIDRDRKEMVCRALHKVHLADLDYVCIEDVQPGELREKTDYLPGDKRVVVPCDSLDNGVLFFEDPFYPKHLGAIYNTPLASDKRQFLGKRLNVRVIKTEDHLKGKHNFLIRTNFLDLISELDSPR